MDQIEGKVALVTGGASGIGYAMCHSLAANGVRVAIADIEEDPLLAAAESFGESNADIMPIQLDVTDRAQFAEVVDQIERDFGNVQIVCNNAGVGVGGHIADMTYRDWDWVLGVNLDGVVNGIVTCAERMRARGEGGHFVNTASMAGQIGIANLSVYNASKFAVVGLSESMRQDLAADGIGVSVLCPNLVRTNILESGRNRPNGLSGDVDTANQLLSSDVPDAEREQRKEAMMSMALDPATVGDMVVDAIRRDDAYIFTHPETATQLQARFDAMQAACGRWDDYRSKL